MTGHNQELTLKVLVRIAVALEKIGENQNTQKRLMKQLIRNTGGFGNQYGPADQGLEES